jgi:hypothetical protein
MVTESVSENKEASRVYVNPTQPVAIALLDVDDTTGGYFQIL